ncbi:MAG: asparagine synthase (glutamine-hydrolyzing) [Nitrospiraceae bacterium]
MCGICGVIGANPSAMLDRMLPALRHRGPDEEGRYVSHNMGIGARRLQVIDPQGGHQPISNETGTVWVALNGEIYNYRELRDELLRNGHRFGSQCDTEVLAHLYEEEGLAGIERLRGMFAFVLWDRDRETLLLARDRIGIKPLYYSTDAGEAGSRFQLAFASELPALASALDRSQPEPEALLDYLTWLYVPSPRTLYRGIQQLPPGHLLRYRHGQVEIVRYAAIDDPVVRPLWSSPAEAREQFIELFRETVKAHLISDAPLGLFLSGGLDSSAILAMMRQVISGTIRTFSIGYAIPSDQSYNELERARAVAAHFGTAHSESVLDPDITMLLPRIAAAMGEPFADSAAIPTYLVSQLAHQSVTVALSGIGGDELFGGYPRHLGMRALPLYLTLPRSLRAALSALATGLLREGVDGQDQTGRLKRFLRFGNGEPVEQYLSWTSFLPPEWGVRAFEPEFLAQVSGYVPLARSRALFQSWPGKTLADQAMGLDIQTYLPDDLLRMADRLSMTHSLELRVPFCDHRLLEFAKGLSVSMRFEGWRLKGFLRTALEPWLPASVLAGPKLGFRVPLARWLREDLRELLQDHLTASSGILRSMLRPAYIQWLLDEHLSGRRNFTDQLYALLMLEVWMAQGIERYEYTVAR